MISKFITSRIPRPKPPLKNDPQARKLYKMEREFVGTSVYHTVRKEDLQTVMEHVCRYYGVAVPKLIIYSKPSEHVFGRSIVTIEKDGRYTDHEIRLNRGFHGANVTTLLHELAHHITDTYFEQHGDHGAQFVAIYMHLLHKYRIIPSDAFRVIAKRRGIRIAARFRPAAIR